MCSFHVNAYRKSINSFLVDSVTKAGRDDWRGRIRPEQLFWPVMHVFFLRWLKDKRWHIDNHWNKTSGKPKLKFIFQEFLITIFCVIKKKYSPSLAIHISKTITQFKFWLLVCIHFVLHFCFKRMNAHFPEKAMSIVYQEDFSLVKNYSLLLVTCNPIPAIHLICSELHAIGWCGEPWSLTTTNDDQPY